MCRMAILTPTTPTTKLKFCYMDPDQLNPFNFSYILSPTRHEQTAATEFLLLGLSGKSEQEEVVFGLFLGMYMVTISGNLLIILAISCDPHLHTPMYFFLANLSSVDICFSSVTIPKALVNHMMGSKVKHRASREGDSVKALTAAGKADRTPGTNCGNILLKEDPVSTNSQTECLLRLKPKMLCVESKEHIFCPTDDNLRSFYMDRKNQTAATEFLLLGLSGKSEQEEVVFGLFLGMYMVTISGNLLIILAISCDPHLHTPMYFFLANLSSVDICFSSVTIPKALVNHLVGSKSISYTECMTQIYFFITFINMDGFLLSVMAYDRYVAICHPLHYTLMMRPRLCILLVVISWFITNLHALLHTLLMVRLIFCSHNAVHHFFCDPYPILKLSCSDTFINDIMAFTVGGLTSITPFMCITVSYAYILSSVLKFPSIQGIRKALSTCGSHLTVVCLFYGAILGVYMHPSSTYSVQDMVATAFFTVVIPMVNPFIYSLRNHDVKGASMKRKGVQSIVKDMGGDNETTVAEFLLLGLSGKSEQEEVVFGLFLGMYMVTISGNLLIILAISCDPHLHTPMYFFLANLSSVDICFSSVTIPKALVNHLVGSKSISYTECMIQIYFFITFINMDGFLLSVMAYDRYVAICHPLHYTLMMRPRLCILLVVISWFITNLHALLHTLLMVRLTFCSHNAVHHFFCDPYPILKLSCSDTFINDLMVFTVGGMIFLTPFSCIVVSYIYIFSNVLKMPSTRGIKKALSTCGSHLTVVSLFYGAILGVYMRPSSSYSLQDTVATVIFTVVTPLLNPFIYSLRNRDMKGTMSRVELRVWFQISEHGSGGQQGDVDSTALPGRTENPGVDTATQKTHYWVSGTIGLSAPCPGRGWGVVEKKNDQICSWRRMGSWQGACPFLRE
ncbi:olfactory receptor 1377 [Sigmodon hispidus]